MKLHHRLATWLLAALLAGMLLLQPIRLVRSVYSGDAFDAMADGLRSGSDAPGPGSWIDDLLCQVRTSGSVGEGPSFAAGHTRP